MELDDRELERLKELVPHKTLSPTPDEICEEIEKLNNIIEETMIIIMKQDKEIERLNNIINKAKIYCEDVIQEHENGEYDVDTVWLAIKEHKGNIKSVLNILNGDLENYWRSDKE